MKKFITVLVLSSVLSSPLFAKSKVKKQVIMSGQVTYNDDGITFRADVTVNNYGVLEIDLKQKIVYPSIQPIAPGPDQIISGPIEEFYSIRQFTACLLYTSPSPRDS